jgi:hypothetical protein
MKMDDSRGLRPKWGWVAWPGWAPRHLYPFGLWASSRWLLLLQVLLMVKY